MEDETTTRSLVVMAQGGDRAALDMLARRTYPRLIDAARLLLRRRIPGLRSRLDTVDLAQSAYRDVLRALPGYRQAAVGSFRGWILGVLRNKVRRRLSFFRAERRDVHREVPIKSELPQPGGDRSPLGLLLLGERRGLLGQALARLSPRHQLVLNLRYFEDLSWKDAASGLGVTEEAAQMLCHRALQRLRELYESAGGEL